MTLQAIPGFQHFQENNLPDIGELMMQHPNLIAYYGSDYMWVARLYKMICKRANAPATLHRLSACAHPCAHPSAHPYT